MQLVQYKHNSGYQHHFLHAINIAPDMAKYSLDVATNVIMQLQLWFCKFNRNYAGAKRHCRHQLL